MSLKWNGRRRAATAAVSALVLLWMALPARAGTVNFDDLSTPPDSLGEIPAGYAGLDWSGLLVFDATRLDEIMGLPPGTVQIGLIPGTVSGHNAAINALADEVEITSGSGFDFHGATFTGVWNDELQIVLQGFRGDDLVYLWGLVASSTVPQALAVDFLNIDRLVIASSGGTPNPAYAEFGEGSQFAMDDFSFTAVPEPTGCVLAILAAATLAGAWRRRR